jgi:hypothetical protein
MKKILILLFLFFNVPTLSQNLKNDFSLGFNYNDNKSSTYSGNLNNATSFQKKWFSVNNILNQNISFTDKIIQNEVSNKLSIGISKNKHSGFLNYQTNYSLTRNLNLDHLTGFGYGIRDSISDVKINYSYAILWQYTTNKDINRLRNSFRIKIVKKTINYNWNIEYYYQPNFVNYKDYLIYGTIKLTYKINGFGFSIIDIFNYNSFSNVKLIHSINLGISHDLEN